MVLGFSRRSSLQRQANHQIGPIRLVAGRIGPNSKDKEFMDEKVIEMFMLIAAHGTESSHWSTTLEERLKRIGRICSFCEAPLPQGVSRREAYCEHCPPPEAHRVRMEFHFQRGWYCRFWDAETEEMLSTQLTFRDAERLYTLVNRGRGLIGGWRVKDVFFHAIGTGRGVVTLTLDESQYHALRTAK
jgi:hypothetical protein